MFSFLLRLFARGRRQETPSKDGKSSAASRLYSVGHSGQAVWSPRDYAVLSKEAYSQNDVAFRCIDEIARAVGSSDWILKQYRGRAEGKVLNDHEILNLLDRPNETDGRASFLYAAAAFLVLHGNSYIEGVAPGSGDNAGRFIWLYSKRPDRIKVIAGPKGVAGYEMNVGGHIHRWAFSDGKCDLGHIKLFNPLDDWYGMPPTEAAARGIDIYNKGGEWNKSLLDNGARVGGILIDNAGELDDDEKYYRAKKQLQESYEGPANAGRTLILPKGADWKTNSHSPKDMDFLQGEQAQARKICRAFGVPAQLIGIPGENKYANMREARLHFWETTVTFYLTIFRDFFNNWLCSRWGEDLYLDFDLSEVPALEPKREAAWSRVQNANFLSVNRKLELVGEEPIGPVGDVILVPSTLVPLEFVVEGDIDDDEPSGDEDGSESQGEEEGQGEEDQGDSEGQEDEGTGEGTGEEGDKASRELLEVALKAKGYGKNRIRELVDVVFGGNGGGE